MTTLQYVKRKGTCVACKNTDQNKGLIESGALYWLVDTGDFPRKFHFECYTKRLIRDNHKWPTEKLTPEFMESVKLLRREDQIKAMGLFEGQEDFVPFENDASPASASATVAELEQEEALEAEKSKNLKRTKKTTPTKFVKKAKLAVIPDMDEEEKLFEGFGTQRDEAC